MNEHRDQGDIKQQNEAHRHTQKYYDSLCKEDGYG